MLFWGGEVRLLTSHFCSTSCGSRKEVGAGSYQPRGMISKHRNPKKHVANIGFESQKSKFLRGKVHFLTFRWPDHEFLHESAQTLQDICSLNSKSYSWKTIVPDVIYEHEICRSRMTFLNEHELHEFTRINILKKIRGDSGYSCSSSSFSRLLYKTNTNRPNSHE